MRQCMPKLKLSRPTRRTLATATAFVTQKRVPTSPAPLLRAVLDPGPSTRRSPEPEPALGAAQRTRPIQHPSIQDPNPLLAPCIFSLQQNLLTLLSTAHPSLSSLSIPDNSSSHDGLSELFEDQLRPLLVFLWSHITNPDPLHIPSSQGEEQMELDASIKQPGVLHSANQNMPDAKDSFADIFRLDTPHSHRIHTSVFPDLVLTGPSTARILPSQTRLAHLVEMIQISSILHKEVDDSPLTSSFPNKLAVLGGDFLLGRASTTLSRLGNSEVVELVASTISNLVEGRITLATPSASAPESLDDAWTTLLRTSYLSSASLLAKASRAAVILGDSGAEKWKEVAYAYGRHLGLGISILKSLHQHQNPTFTFSENWISWGAPLLYAWEENPKTMAPILQRAFSQTDDISLARELCTSPAVIQRTRSLALNHLEQAAKLGDMVSAPPEAKGMLRWICENASKPP